MVYDFYLMHFKSGILSYKKLSKINPILITEFKKALDRITPETWEIIKDIFQEKIEFTYSIEEKMCFTILASTLGLTFLNKDTYFISELCTVLTMLNKNPNNYVKYATFVFQEPIYSLIIKINQKSCIFGYLDLLASILKQDVLNSREETLNRILTFLYHLNDEEYYIFFNPNDELPEIYQKVISFMFESNKKGIIFLTQDFRDIALLNKWNEIPELKENLINEIVQIEKEYFDKLSITKRLLEVIRTNKQIIRFRKKPENE